ncbi:ComF family protein [Haloferula sp. BvORR071]|uniref:ComF family protein n=1 Tax=Haloferula sp. BvORR071 TaxID=1396141 RepID=UPI000695EFF6|nr:ComF family protein [Haloferula sp. BvORR071]
MTTDEAAAPATPVAVPVRGWWARCLDLLFPSVCNACGQSTKGDAALCEACRAAIPSLQSPFCLRCAEEFEGRIEGDFECSNCRNLDFDFAFARPAVANHPVVLQMIHELKYQRRIHLAPELGRMAQRSFGEDPRLLEALAGKWPLVPVPLHRRRQLWRHFNQAEEIARPIAALTGLPLCRGLARQRGTGSQTRLSRAQRLKNLRGAFALTREGERHFAAHPGGAVLVDDVFTTGATTGECARVLRKAGVQKVVVVTVMRG